MKLNVLLGDAYKEGMTADEIISALEKVADPIHKRVKAKSRCKRYGDGKNQVRCNPFTSKDKRDLNRYGKSIEQKNANATFNHFL